MDYRQCSFNLIKYELTFNKIHLPLAPLSNLDTLSKMHGLLARNGSKNYFFLSLVLLVKEYETCHYNDQ